VSDDHERMTRLQKLAALGEVAAGVSHETRNLMTAIAGFAQVAKQRAQDPESALRYFTMIEREAQRCIELLERHLDLSRGSSIHAEPLDIAGVIAQVASVAQHQIALHRIELRVDAPELPLVRGHRGELHQVLLNLLINALHATPAGGEIAITARHADRSIEIAVDDTGSGVPPELRDKIFDAFFTTKQDRGTGLGLAVSRQIVGAHGGTLELDPRHTQGARFIVKLPVAA
jgi:signal transduction histidine kinase